MCFDFLALIRTSYRSTLYPSVSIITVWRGYSHATLFLWSSSLCASETEIVGVREREREFAGRKCDPLSFLSLFFFFVEHGKVEAEHIEPTWLKCQRVLLSSSFTFSLKGKLISVVFSLQAQHTRTDGWSDKWQVRQHKRQRQAVVKPRKTKEKYIN